MPKLELVPQIGSRAHSETLANEGWVRRICPSSPGALWSVEWGLWRCCRESSILRVLMEQESQRKPSVGWEGGVVPGLTCLSSRNPSWSHCFRVNRRVWFEYLQHLVLQLTNRSWDDTSVMSPHLGLLLSPTQKLNYKLNKTHLFSWPILVLYDMAYISGKACSVENPVRFRNENYSIWLSCLRA